jgi:hypothetical protein
MGHAVSMTWIVGKASNVRPGSTFDQASNDQVTSLQASAKPASALPRVHRARRACARDCFNYAVGCLVRESGPSRPGNARAPAGGKNHHIDFMQEIILVYKKFISLTSKFM